MTPTTLSLLVHFITLNYASYQDCGSYFPNYRTTFDLSPLTLSEQTNLSYYLVKHATEDYEFIFNFCADLVTMPFPGACNWDDRKVKDPSGIEIFRPANTTSMAWQATKDGNGFCFRISGSKEAENNKYNTSDLITYRLIDSNDPSYGVMMHYNYGDWDSGCGSNNRQFDIAVVCDQEIDNIPDEGEIITEPNTCEYYLEIKSIYGCPLECGHGRDDNHTLCSGNGLCGYDHWNGQSVCKCHAGFGGSICNETVQFEADIAWYDDVGCESNSTYSFEFDTMYGYSIHYDLQWFVDGYLDGYGYLNGSNGNKYYNLNGLPTDSNTYYLNLFESQKLDTSICNNNPPGYEFGLIYQAHKVDPDAPCYSLGRTLGNISLFEQTLPEKGIHITLEGGDGLYCDTGDSRQTDIYLICPSSSNRLELYNDITGLNTLYSEYYISEPGKCRYEIEIYSVAACPCQCISYDDVRDSISICNQNGMCGYDKSLDLTRCFCNDNMKINKPENVHCKIPNSTYSPSEAPTLAPTEATKLECGQYYIGSLLSYEADHFNFSVNSSIGTIGSDVTFNACGSSFDTKLHLKYNGVIVGYNDDNTEKCSHRQSYLEATAYPNRTYTLIVQGYLEEFGQYHINITCRDITPIEVPKLECGQYYDGSTSKDESVHFIFSVDSPLGSVVTFDACGSSSSFDTLLSLIYNGSEVGYNDDNTEKCLDRQSHLESIVLPNRNYTLILRGFLGDWGQYHVDITCRDITTSPTTVPSNNPTAKPIATEAYSLYGAWTDYDYSTDRTYQIKINVDEMCEYVKFEFITSAGCTDSWFGFGIGFGIGIGGDYDFQNNGYALILLTGIGTSDSNSVYETTLMSGEITEMIQPQTKQNLRDCSTDINIRDCMQYTVCYRDFISSDEENDYFKFKEGGNDIIWAIGEVTTNISFINARQSVLYVEGESICYTDTTTTTTALTTQITVDQESKESMGSSDSNEMWRIIGIVFIILFGLVLVFLIFQMYKTRKKAVLSTKGYMHGRVNSTDNVNDGDNEMAIMNTTCTNPTDELL